MQSAFRRLDRLNLHIAESTDMLESILNLLAFVAKLGLVADMHPLAPPADPKDRASRLDTVFRGLEQRSRHGFEIGRLHPGHLREHPVSDGEHAAHENARTVTETAETLILFSYIGNGKFYPVSFSVYLPEIFLHCSPIGSVI